MARKTPDSVKWVPEIVYEENGSKIPYIHVPDGEDDPGMLFIFLSRQTGETEPGEDGEDVPIVEMDLHQYADMATLKRGLPAEAYDQVRAVLGLLPLKEAEAKGAKISGLVRDEVAVRTNPDLRRQEFQGAVDAELSKRLDEKKGQA
jgi:hypothetical protein